MLYPFTKGHSEKINRRRSSLNRYTDGKRQTWEGEWGKKGAVYWIERAFYLSFTRCGLPYSCQALPFPLCRRLAVRTGSGLFVSSLLPVGVERCEERNVCGSEREGRLLLLFASNQEGTPADLCTWTHTRTTVVWSCTWIIKRTQMVDSRCLTNRHNSVWLDTWSLLINWSDSWLIRDRNKSSMAGSQPQHMSRQPTLFTTLYWFTPIQWPLGMWGSFWHEMFHPSFTSSVPHSWSPRPHRKSKTFASKSFQCVTADTVSTRCDAQI